MLRPLVPPASGLADDLLSLHDDVVAAFEIDGIPLAATVRQATLREGLSRPYVLDVALEIADLVVEVDALVGRSCEFSFDRTASMRTVHGVIDRAEAIPGAAYGDRTNLRLRVVPALALLAHRVNSRIFQDTSTLDIVRDVLLGTSAPRGGPREGLAAFERTIDTATIDATHYQPPRDFCVQYGESDLAFVSRLLEEEGIAYRFVHDDEHEVLTLVDDNGDYPQVEIEATEGLSHLAWERVRQADDVLRRHWNFLGPQDGVDHREDASSRGNDPIVVYTHAVERGRHEHDGGEPRRIHDVQGRAARRDQDLLRSGDWIARGSTNAIGITAGCVFETDVGEHPRVLVVSVVHTFGGHGADHSGRIGYHNNFVAIPATATFRPPRVTSRPIVAGPQTAIVTGPAGEEIHTDALGRVKVLFHWDRDGIDARGRSQRHDASSSVWVRVAHGWGGPGFGMMFIPRVGMEVVVAFLDGNPDRPLVVGCVYNGANRPPLALPDEKARSTIRSATTPGGAGSNELRFDDTQGREEVYVHAQRDHNTVIERRRTHEVGEEEHLHVESHRYREVGGNEEVTIEGSQRVTVNGGGDLEVRGIEVRVDKQYHVIASGDVYIEAPERIELVCGNSSIMMTPDRIEVHAGGRAIVDLDANVIARSSDESELRLDTTAELRAREGAVLTLTATAVLESDAAQAGLELAAGALLHGEDARIETGATTFTCDGSSATVTSSAITMQGGDETVIEGGGGRGVFSSGRVQLD